MPAPLAATLYYNCHYLQGYSPLPRFYMTSETNAAVCTRYYKQIIQKHSYPGQASISFQLYLHLRRILLESMAFLFLESILIHYLQATFLFEIKYDNERCKPVYIIFSRYMTLAGSFANKSKPYLY